MQSAELTTLNEATSVKAMGRAHHALLETLSLVRVGGTYSPTQPLRPLRPVVCGMCCKDKVTA
jgi:hypothetical protein